MALGVRRSEGESAARVAAASRAALAWPLAHEAELWVTPVSDEAIALGAYQRAHGLPERAHLVRRGSGGPAVRVGEGTLYVALVLPEPGALTACDPSRIVNRYVRPLLRALTRAGALAHHFGRDWVSVAHRPAAWVGFAHEAASQRTVFEAFVAVSTPFAVDPARASFLGKAPGTLAEIAGKPIAIARVADLVVASYAEAYGLAAMPLGPFPSLTDAAGDDADDVGADPPFAAVVDEAIGPLGAGPDAAGRFRVGGDLLASADAVRALEQLAATTPDAELDAAIDALFASDRVALDGVRSLASFAQVIREARLAAR